MPRISAQRQQDRYDAILEAGRIVLAARGFGGASISGIARQAGVSDGLIYRYFEDKRDLLMAVLAQFYNRIIEDLEITLEHEPDFRSRIRTLVATHVHLFASDTEMCRLFLTEVRVAANYRATPIYALNRRYTSTVLRVTRDGIAEGVIPADTDARLLRDMLFGGIEHFAWRYVNNPESVDLEAGAQRIAETLLVGVCGVQA